MSEMPINNDHLPANQQDVGNEPIYDESPPPVIGRRVDFGKNDINVPEKGTMDFYTALQFLATGSKITKKEWGDNNYYGFMHEAWLCLHDPSGKVNSWIISEGDMAGTDYMLVN